MKTAIFSFVLLAVYNTTNADTPRSAGFQICQNGVRQVRKARVKGPDHRVRLNLVLARYHADFPIMRWTRWVAILTSVRQIIAPKEYDDFLQVEWAMERHGRRSRFLVLDIALELTPAPPSSPAERCYTKV
jgi:hypothetical protein